MSWQDVNWAQSGRRDVFSFHAVDPFSLEEVYRLTADPSDCSITYGYYTDNKYQGDLTLVGTDHMQGGMTNLIRVKHGVSLPDGTEEEEVLGTFFVDGMPERKEQNGIIRYRCNCYSTMWRLSQGLLQDDFVWHTGDKCEAKLRRLVEYPGGKLRLSGGIDIDKAHTVDGRFAAGENRLEKVNEYAGYSNWVLDVDDYGWYVLSPYSSPKERSESFEFVNGSNCVYMPELDETWETEVFNKVICRWSRESDPGDGLGVCDRYEESLPRSNPFSFERYGMWVEEFLDLTEATPREDMVAKVRAFLSEHDGATPCVTLKHVNIPHLRCGMTVRFTRDADGPSKWEVVQMNPDSLRPLLMTETKLKAVL